MDESKMFAPKVETGAERENTKEIEKPFADLKGGETFWIEQNEIFEEGIPGRPWLYMKIKNTNQAMFLPTGTISDFKPEQMVILAEAEISKK